MGDSNIWPDAGPPSPNDEHMSSPRNQRDSTSPGQSEYDSNTERTTSRKRTNTTSSGNGDRRTANKICRVCGDKAFSYNFNVITCESCKAFFRRNANKEKDIRCPFNNKCEINVVSRRFCQKCRLTKCFDVGMKKEWIMSDEARLEKRQRVEENRERRLQDALMRTDPSEGISLRSRVKSESRMDESNLTVREYVMKNEEALRQKSCSESMQIAAPPVNTATFPSMANYSSMMDTVPTTAPNSLVDLTSSAQVVPLRELDIDVSSGQMFPTMEAAQMNHPTSDLDLVSGLIPPASAVESSLIAHAQLAAAQVQVQAAIEQQQQIVAAVAQQVAAQIAAPSAPMEQLIVPAQQQLPTLAQSLPTALSTPLLAPPLGSSVAPPPTIMHPLAPPMGTEMVTIPKEVLVTLIENSCKRPTASCTCTCRCGRYPASSVIVDEVTKDLLAAGASSNANAAACSGCDVTMNILADEVQLETAEDFQMNGLIPAPNSEPVSSLITPWVNTESTKIDAPPIPEIGVSNTYPSIEGIFTSNSPIVDSIHLPPVVTISRPTTGLTRTDSDQLTDIEAAFQKKLLRPFDTRLRPSKPPSRDIAVVEQIARVALALPIFRSVPRRDQISLLKARCTDFHLLRVAFDYDPKRTNSEACLFGLGVQEECAGLLRSLCEEVRRSSAAITLLAIICLLGFDKVGAKESVRSADEQTRLLLKRLLFTLLNEDSNKCECEYHVMMSLISRIREKSNRLPQIGRDARMVERSLAQSWRM